MRRRLPRKRRSGWSERINDAVKENKVIDYKKEKRTDLSVIAQHTRLGNITESSLNKSLSEFRKKVNRFREKRNIKYSFSKEETDMLLKAMENGGMIEKAVDTEVKAGEAKSQTAGKKPSEGRKQEHVAEVAERINQPLLLEEANILGKLISANAKEIGATMVGQLHKATSSAHFSSPIKHSVADFLYSVKSFSLTNEV